ncbi:MAG: class I SAM-dependent methyltransferase [Bacteroidales bacterium]
MEQFNRKQHWESIYQTKQPEEVSWFQPVPVTSLEFIKYFNVPTNAKIIDVGGGDSLFVDNLLDMGYEDITVLDISEAALQRAKQRLNDRAAKVKWTVQDAAKFVPTEKYDIRQYSEISMEQRLKGCFEKIRCITVDHNTPFNTVQNFIFCSFRRL